MINLYKNNKSTTLTAILPSGSTTLSQYAIFFDLFSTIYDFQQQITATLTDDINIEIINVRLNPGGYGYDPYTIDRAQEGTSSRTWPIGTKIELRITASMLTNLATNEGLSSYCTKIGGKFNWVDLRNPSLRQPNETVTKHAIRDINGYGAIYLKKGTLGTSYSTSGGVNSAIGTDGTSFVAYGYGSDQGTSISGFAKHSGIAISGIATGYNSINVGNRSITTGERSKTIGSNNVNTGIGSTVIGDDQSNFLDSSLMTSSIPAKPVRPNITSGLLQDFNLVDSNLSGVFWSRPLDFAGGATWTTGSPYAWGKVVKVASHVGYQYVSTDYNSDPLDKFNISTYTPSLSGNDPYFGTSSSSPYNDGNIDWWCTPNVGYTILLPNKFVVEEIGIVIFESSGISVQPSISFGKTGDTSMFVSNQITTGLTGPYKTQRWVLNSSEAVDSLVININTLATGATLLGQVYFKGFYVSHWL